MYEVNLRIMLVGLSAEAAEAIQQVPARDRFTHGFALASRFSECPLQNGAFDVVIFTEEAMESLSISLICQGAGEKARCILVTDAPQKLKPEELKLLDEIWPAPLTAGLAAHYFDRFVQKLKDIKEAWLTKVYWQTTINTSPDLIWYKDKMGAHLEVNDAFCEAVGREKNDIRGRGHYYIWGLTKEQYEQGEFVCNETEVAVMKAGRAMCFNEHVLSKRNGMRRLRTFKAPVFDEEGSIMGTVGVAMDVTREREYQKKIIALTRHDPLTDLPNRRYFYDFVEEHFDEPKHLVEFDIDNFKTFNDRFGHQVGDEVLLAFSRTLEQAFKQGFVARFGGDEFLALFCGDYSREQVRQAIAKFQHLLKEKSLSMQTGQVNASIGVAYDPTGVVPIDDLYQRADQALYAAKRQGKNCSMEWSPELKKELSGNQQ